jgi:hypothetical protein
VREHGRSVQRLADWFASWTADNEGRMSAAAVRNLDDSDAQLARGESEGTDNLTLTSSTPKPPPFEATGDFNSDLAFENRYAYGGNYDGVQIWDVRDNETPRLASSIHCPGSQNDVTVNDGILVTSTDSVRNKAECEGNVSVPTTSPEYGQPTNWEGLRVFRRVRDQPQADQRREEVQLRHAERSDPGAVQSSLAGPAFRRRAPAGTDAEPGRGGTFPPSPD